MDLATTTQAAAIKTVVSKGRYDNQWKAESSLPLACGRFLKVNTWKTSRGLQTSVQAVKVEGNMESHMLFGDYGKTIKTFPEIKRVNEKAISIAHTSALVGIEKFVEEANEFYAKGEE